MLGVAVLIVVRRRAAEWARGLSSALRETDDWKSALLGVTLIALALLTMRITSWAPYVWLGVFAISFALGFGVRSVWAAELRDRDGR